MRTSLRTAQEGFTLIELLIALTIGTVVLGGAFGLLVSHWNLYRVQREVADVTTTLRGASALLSWDLREVSASAGDLYAMTANSVKIRKVTAAAIVCAYYDVGSDRRRVGMRKLSGEILTSAGDSALVYLPGSDSWKSFEVTAIWDQGQAWGSGGTPVCFWGDSSVNEPRPEGTLELRGDTTDLVDLTTGSMLYTFRPTEYALFQDEGRWWLGRREGTATSWEIITGPMRSPADSGLFLLYYDASGNATSDPTAVNRVEVHLRAESVGGLPKWGRGSFQAIRDSATTTIFLRNN